MCVKFRITITWFISTRQCLGMGTTYFSFQYLSEEVNQYLRNINRYYVRDKRERLDSLGATLRNPYLQNFFSLWFFRYDVFDLKKSATKAHQRYTGPTKFENEICKTCWTKPTSDTQKHSDCLALTELAIIFRRLCAMLAESWKNIVENDPKYFD